MLLFLILKLVGVLYNLIDAAVAPEVPILDAMLYPETESQTIQLTASPTTHTESSNYCPEIIVETSKYFDKIACLIKSFIQGSEFNKSALF